VRSGERKSGRYKKHNKVRFLYTTSEQVTAGSCARAARIEVEIEDILSDHGQNEEEIFRLHRPLF
jgi:hypothetical protein